MIRRLKDKKTAMDRAREMLRNRLNGVSSTTSTTTPSPFITVVDQTRKNNRPRPFQRLQTPTTTISSLIQASTTVPPPQPPGIHDYMVTEF